MSNEWAHDAAWKEVPTVNSITLGGFAVAGSAARAAVVAGACPRGVVPAQLAADGSGFTVTGTAVRGDVVVAQPRLQLQKYPFMAHGAVTNGAELGSHRVWDPV